LQGGNRLSQVEGRHRVAQTAHATSLLAAPGTTDIYNAITFARKPQYPRTVGRKQSNCHCLLFHCLTVAHELKQERVA